MEYRYLIVAGLIAFAACNSNSNNATQNNTTQKESSSSVLPSNAPAEKMIKYDFAHPQKKWTLPPDLKEISGISWVGDNKFLAIEDLHPILYLLKLDNAASVEKKVPFKETEKEKFDVEDVTVVDNKAYALYSHGKIFEVDNWNGQPSVKEYKTFLSKENNTEGICYDPVTHNLLVACKNESDVADEKKSTRAIYEFDLRDDSLKSTPFLLIHKKDIKAIAGEKLEFFPAAIAVHPKTHHIYILSTRGNKCIAEYTHDGNLVGVELLDAELMPQPEGMSFTSEGVMYISTEGKHGEPASILAFTAGAGK